MVKTRFKTAGFTLVEALLVVAIIGVLFFVVPQIFTQVIRYYQLHNAKVEIQRDARACLDLINRFLRQAQASTVTIDRASASQPPFSRITFTTIENQQLQFYQSGKQLMQAQVAGGVTHTTMISNNLRFVAFTYPRSDDPTIVSVAITMEKSTYGGGSKALELSIEKVRVMNP